MVISRVVIGYRKTVTSIIVEMQKLLYRSNPEYSQIIKSIGNTPIITKIDECKVLSDELKSVKDIEGNIAEVGSYYGATASVMHETNPDKKLYVFDTFNGIPNVGYFDFPFRKGDYKSSYTYVRNKFAGLNVEIRRGVFPDTATGIEENFSFVHFDCDTYMAAKNSLEFFFDKLSFNGKILLHDFNQKGIRMAVEEFCGRNDLTYRVIGKTQAVIEK